MNKIFISRFSIKEQALFAKRLSFLVGAGVPIVESLHMIRKQTRGKHKGTFLDAVINDVSNGRYLSTSLSTHPRMFGDFAINIIKVGEAGGMLSQNLQFLGHELEKMHALKRKIISALIYPCFITITTLGLTIFLTAYIFPKLTPIFKSLHTDLPLTTQALIWISAYIREWGLITFFVLVFLFVLLYLARRFLQPVRYANDIAVLKIPLWGGIAKRYALANYCRTFGLMLKSGMHVSEAAAMAAKTSRNLLYRLAGERLEEGVIRGSTLSTGLSEYPRLFPEIMTHLIAIGEKTGTLSQTFIYLADHFESEVDERTKNLSNSIEPILMIVLGLLVGIIAISVITPIYGITEHLEPR